MEYPGLDGVRDFQQVTFSVADGGTVRALTEVVDLKNRRLTGIYMPTVWAAAAISFQGHYASAANLFDVYDEGGEVSLASATCVAASRLITLTDRSVPLEVMKYLRLRSGLTGAAVTQAVGCIAFLLFLPVSE